MEGKEGWGTTHGEEEVGDVVRDVHGDPHIREVEAIRQPDQGQRDDMMHDQLLEILAGLLQQQHQDQPLLGPVARLQQVVGLEPGVVGAVGEALVHAADVEEPDGGAGEDVEADGPGDGEVEGGVELLEEAGLLAAAADAAVDGNGADEALHEELAGEGEDDGVEGDEAEVAGALAILGDGADVGGEGGGALVRGRVGVGEEEEGVEGVVRARAGEVVGGDGGADEQEREQPGVAVARAAEAAEELAGLRALALTVVRGFAVGGSGSGGAVGGGVVEGGGAREVRDNGAGAGVAARVGAEAGAFPSAGLGAGGVVVQVGAGCVPGGGCDGRVSAAICLACRHSGDCAIALSCLCRV